MCWPRFVHNKLIVILLLLAWLGTAQASTSLTLQSTCLGNGWFQYQLNMKKDPFVTSVSIQHFWVATTNVDDQSTTSTNFVFGWDVLAYGQTYAEWSCAASNWPPTDPPFTETFLLHSPETSWKMFTSSNRLAGANMDFTLQWNNLAPYGAGQTESIVAGGHCLVPGNPNEADGSPTNCTYVVELVPDIIINHLIQTNGSIYGVDLTWNGTSTFALQASADLNHWTNVTYIWSSPPETVWTTNAPLNSYGQFFRVALVANGYQTNPPALFSGAQSP
jgi:hypothetical protein